jgi:hypothetical protein
VEQDLLTLPEHPSSNPVFSWVRVIKKGDVLALTMFFFFIRNENGNFTITDLKIALKRRYRNTLNPFT